MADHLDPYPLASAFVPSTLVELLRWRGTQQPDARAYAYLPDGETEKSSLTYGELDRQARALGGRLQALGLAGQSALVLYPPGLEFLAAFFGCQYARVVAVPAYPPHRNRSLDRLQAIVADARPALVLSTAGVSASLESFFDQAPELQNLRWLTTDVLPEGMEEAWNDPKVTGDTLAFLQYTSGSTSMPRGVMLSHGNVLHNSAVIAHGFDHSPHSNGVFWLPVYHDMGLIGGVLQPLYIGRPSVLMPPASFLSSPYRWLQAISRYQATTSGAPNFAYDLCVRKITPAQRATLDLGSWELAFTGAEPVRADTLDRFAETFAPCGFRRQAFYPCYGLAEASLMVTGGQKDRPPVTVSVHKGSLEQHRAVLAAPGQAGAQTLVGCGKSLLDLKVRIVHPERLTRCLPGEVGEVWVAGPSVAQGYWNRPAVNEQVFRAHLADTGEGPFLRTGDLGFLHEGELFLTGRIKDLIILFGRNHYPQDIERTVEDSHPALRPSCAAAFTVAVEGDERLVVAAEIDHRHRNLNTDEVIGAIRQAVAEEHEVQVHAVALLKVGRIPKTSSGKIQRHACRAGFLARSLEILAEWARQVEEVKLPPLAAEVNGNGHVPSPNGRNGQPSRTKEDIQDWLVIHLARRLGVAEHAIDVREPFSRYGLDSATAVSLTGDLEAWLGRRLPTTLAYEYPTIEALSQHLAGETGGSRALVTKGLHPSPEKDGVTGREPIALIGMGCRFPGAGSPEAFWHLLRSGVDAITEVPPERWDLSAWFDPNPTSPGKMNTRWGGFLGQVDGFDYAFFGISPREAACMDPQQRLLLEVAWEALEDAGQAPGCLAGSQTGVFIGISNNDYGRLVLPDAPVSDAYLGTGNALSIAANRLSYVLDVRGPSLAVDTACSSSLVAVHLACQSLWNRECTLALAGGVNLILSPAVTVNFTKAGLMAPDGHCKAFDRRANGYVRGEGAGLVVLKPLAKALSDGDPIYAVIRGTAINQDGRSNGLTAPNRQAQEAVLREAYRHAGVSPGQVDYVEAHGTGTALGDPIEAKALGTVLAIDRPPGRHCALGSVKTNIGHLEAAAGVAGLIKVALALKHRALPPSLHFLEPNPHIPFADLPLRVQQTLGPWPKESRPSLAGVSSFGFGGTNAHVVVEEAPVAPAAARAVLPAAGSAYLLPISARSPEALRALAGAYRHLLAAQGNGDLPALSDLAYTAGVRRSHHDHRLALVGSSRADMVRQLDAVLQEGDRWGSVSVPRPAGRRPKLAFVFSGQGSQWWAMGRELLAQEPVFRAALEQCDDSLRRHAGWSLFDELTAAEAQSRLDQTEFAQPVLFALQVALAALWRSWGIVPDAVVGHSMGEVAAAQVAGILSLADAVRLIVQRGRLMQPAAGRGKMAAVELPPDQVEPVLAGYGERVSVAALNSPTSLVLSGDPPALEEVLDSLRHRGGSSRTLRGEWAFHSPQMTPAGTDLVRALKDLQPQPATIPMFSTVTGGSRDGREFDAVYWGRNAREPVRFAAAVEAMVQAGCEAFVELSPHPVLSGAIMECLRHKGREGTVLPSLRRGQGERATLLKSLGTLYSRGFSVAWEKLYPSGGRCVSLPSYPWQRERCWLEGLPTKQIPNGEGPGTESLDGWFYEFQWQPSAGPDEGQAYASQPVASPGTWLIFGDGNGAGAALAERWRELGGSCFLVNAGEAYERSGENTLRVHPGRPEDLRQLLRDVFGTDRPACRGIVHLWSLDAPSSEEPTVASLEAAQERGCGQVLLLMQELTRLGWSELPRLWLVTRGAQPVGENPGPLALAQAPLWGLGRTLAQEQPALWGGLVDLDPDLSASEAAAQLAAEIAGSDKEDQTAYRHGRRYVARLVRKPPVGRPASPYCWRTDGSYLITGGLGDLGLQVARWLVGQGARRLILLGRTPLPPRRRWNEPEPGSRLAAQIAAIRELESLGASVHLGAVDVADETQLAAFLDEYRRDGWPPIRGVVHAAGLVELQAICEADPATLRAVLRPKLAGAWLLHQLLEEEPLDFFVLFSSVSALLSSPLLGPYAAANAFLDALAHFRRARGQTALSINWGFWDEVGMASRHLKARPQVLRGVEGISPRQGLLVLERLIHQRDWTQVAALRVNWSHWRRLYPAFSEMPLVAHLTREESGAGDPALPRASFGLDREALLALDPALRQPWLESQLGEQAARMLGFATGLIDLHRPLNQFGFDSLMTIELKNRIELDLGVALPMATLLQGPTVAELAAAILARLPEPSSPGDQAKLDELVQQLEQLSDEQVKALLSGDTILT
jgi:acyl transferase domain-containing protein/acyl-CoA synthetase (AMP-forming)/AMP-acid ligase II/acyl carrier protein